MAHDGEEDFGLDRFEAAFTDLRAVVVRPAAPEVAADHLARMQATSGGTVAATAAASSLAPRATADSFWTTPRQAAAAIAAVAVGLFGLGGLGMAGALPGPVQDFVATVTDPLGLDLPRSDDPAPVRQGHGRGDDDGTEPGQGSGATLAPGQTGSAPGQSGETPANGGEPPGQSGSTPGQSGDNPSVTAPGQSGESPSATAPGQVDNPSATAPGQSGSAPGQSGSAGANGNGNGGGNGNAGGTATRGNGNGNGGTAPGRS